MLWKYGNNLVMSGHNLQKGLSEMDNGHFACFMQWTRAEMFWGINREHLDIITYINVPSIYNFFKRMISCDVTMWRLNKNFRELHFWSETFTKSYRENVTGIDGYLWADIHSKCQTWSPSLLISALVWLISINLCLDHQIKPQPQTDILAQPTELQNTTELPNLLTHLTSFVGMIKSGI